MNSRTVEIIKEAVLQKNAKLKMHGMLRGLALKG